MEETTEPSSGSLYLTPEEAANIIGCSRAVIHKWARLGRMPVARFGALVRIPRDEFFAWLKTKNQPVMPVQRRGTR